MTLLRGRSIASAVLLAALLYAAQRSVGPVPALGAFLDPVRGVWAAARVAEWPDSAAARIAGLEAPVRVLFDDRGVPHIFAGSVADATRALGYVVARDRLFQLELIARAPAGTLTELVGAAALSADRYRRRLGLAWSADRNFRELDDSPELAATLDAYADGVNGWIDGLRHEDLPLEFHLLGATPQRWRPVYSLYQLKQMGWTLAYQNTERRKRAAAAVVGWKAADALFPIDHPIQEPIQTNGHDGPRFDRQTLPPPGPADAETARSVAAFESLLGAGIGPLAGRRNPFPWATSGPSADAGCPGTVLRVCPGEDEAVLGSNNWAVGPVKTASGWALLAGDPHLDLTLPSIWYEAHLVVPGDLDVYGVTIPGTPGIVIGFNRDVAWSFTNTGADVMDFYEETVDDPDQPRRYRLDGEWRPLDMRIEEYRDPSGSVIAVDTIYHTHRGPLLSEGSRHVSMRWTVLERQGELRALNDATRATTIDEWLASMVRYVAPAQNGVVADRLGSIAIRSHGWFPIRPGDGRGDVVRDGSTSDSDWLGYWPPNRYPFSIDPPRGFLSSANQQPIDPRQESGYLGADWPPPWRAIRINTLLREGSDLTPRDLQRFQTDPSSPRADVFAAAFLNAAESTEARGNGDQMLRDAARLLGAWDRRYTKDNTGAVLFELAMSDLASRVWDELETDAGGARRRVATPRSSILASLLDDPTSVWWDDTRSADVVESRDVILVASLRAALQQAREQLGRDDGDDWRWERNRHANIYHLTGYPSFSALNLPVQGGPETISPSSGRGTHGASWRMVVELGDEVRAWTIYPGGQSGNPVSSRYADRIPRWEDGELDEVIFPRTPGGLPAERIVSTLTLTGRGGN